MEQYKIKFLALLQVMAIILVVIYHSFHEYPDGNYGFDIWGMRLLASLRMPVFLFISGYLMVLTTNRKNPDWSRYALNKVKRLLIPFVVLSLITFTPRALMSSFADDEIPLTAEALGESLLYSGKMVIPFFWYLQASMILLCGTYALVLLAKKISVRPVSVYLTLFLAAAAAKSADLVLTDFLSIHNIARLSVFFFAGTLYACVPAKADKAVPWTAPPFTLTLAAVWVTLFVFFENSRSAEIIISLTAIATFISIAKTLVARDITVLDHLIGANYIIFLLSWYFNILAQQVLSHFCPGIPWQVHTLLSVTLGVYCPLLILNLMRRHKDRSLTRLCALLLGQRL